MRLLLRHQLWATKGGIGYSCYTRMKRQILNVFETFNEKSRTKLVCRESSSGRRVLHIAGTLAFSRQRRLYASHHLSEAFFFTYKRTLRMSKLKKCHVIVFFGLFHFAPVHCFLILHPCILLWLMFLVISFFLFREYQTSTCCSVKLTLLIRSDSMEIGWEALKV